MRPHGAAAAVALSLLPALASGQASTQFLPPQTGVYAANADLVPPFNVSTAEECMQACVSYNSSNKYTGCIHANVCGDTAPLRCGIGGYTRLYAIVAGSSCSYFQRVMPRNDAPVTPTIPYLLQVPTGNVTLAAGSLLAEAVSTNVEYLLSWSVDDILFNFRKRAGNPSPPGQCVGWECHANWVEGSIAGMFLMGSGGVLRWQEVPQLRANMDAVIEGIAQCADATGYLMAFPEANLPDDEHPDYTLSWTVHGFLEAAVAGNAQALPLIRKMMDYFNNHTCLPTFLPPDGGNSPWQTPAGSPPPGWNGVNNTGSGTPTGHLIYLISQGIIHNTRMALSPAGRQADVELVEGLYQEGWWLNDLMSRNLSAIWQKQWFSHNYQLTAVEAYMDMYVLTGNDTYLGAVLAAWDMHYGHWLHVGGSLAINEAQYYAPGSYYLTADFPDSDGVNPTHPRERQYLQRREMVLDADGQWRLPAQHGHSDGALAHSRGHGHSHGHGFGSGGDWGNHATGETCGSSFWTRLNQRLHRLHPDNETYTAEIERSLYNVALANQGPDGSGIRYFTNLHKTKQTPGDIVTCCEGQGTRWLGAIQEFLFSTAPGAATPAVYVDLYAPSTFVTPVTGYAGAGVNVTVITTWPFGPEVTVLVTPLGSGPVTLDLALRIPGWTTGLVAVTVGGSPWPQAGGPGSYLHVSQQWAGAGASTAVSFGLPATFGVHPYTGFTQLPPYQRYAYTWGPLVLAAEGPASLWNATVDCMVIAGVDPLSPSSWMRPVGPLMWNVTTAAGAEVTFFPYFQVQQELFTAYPIVVPPAAGAVAA